MSDQHMALLFEYSFYAGVLIVLFALGWGVASAVRRRWPRLLGAAALLIVGLVFVTAPSFVSRRMEVDLGPRDEMVDGERHLSLTNWNGSDYGFLSDLPDVVVLQMGNRDVTDQTLQSLVGMTRLRELDLNDSGITDRGLELIAGLPRLRTLRLRGTDISDTGLAHLLEESGPIRQLDVRGTDVSKELIDEWQALGDDRRALQ